MCEKCTDSAVELFKVEYDKIKSEQAQRIGFRDNMLFVYLASVGAVSGWVFTNLGAPNSSEFVPLALLTIPWLGVVLGWTYLVNDHMISRMGKYVDTVLSKRAVDLSRELLVVDLEEVDGKTDPIDMFYGWEPFHKSDAWRVSRKNAQLVVDIFTFIVPPAIAIVGFCFASKWQPEMNFQSWTAYDWFIALTIFAEGISLFVLLLMFVDISDRKRSLKNNTRNSTRVANKVSDCEQ